MDSTNRYGDECSMIFLDLVEFEYSFGRDLRGFEVAGFEYKCIDENGAVKLKARRSRDL